MECMISSGKLDLVSSGIFITIGEEPVNMRVMIGGEPTVTVVLHFHRGTQTLGRPMERKVSPDGAFDEWHIYDSYEGEAGHTRAPVPVIVFKEKDELKELFLQLCVYRLPDGQTRVEYAWWSSQCGAQSGM